MSDRVDYLRLPGRSVRVADGINNTPEAYQVKLISTLWMSGISHSLRLSFWQDDVSKQVFWHEYSGDVEVPIYPVSWEYDGDGYEDRIFGGERVTKIHKVGCMGRDKQYLIGPELHLVWNVREADGTLDESCRKRLEGMVYGWAYQYWSHDTAERAATFEAVLKALDSAPDSYNDDVGSFIICENDSDFQKDQVSRMIKFKASNAWNTAH